jgi:serine/threonine-protein kinase
MDDRKTRIARLFDEATDLDETLRADWLTAVCGDDGTLRQELERLLLADARAKNFLRTPPSIDATRDESTADRPPPTAFGRYRVERSIGKGGMGEVWLAARHDDDFAQRVAVKQVAYPTPGLLQRFRRERQILATLDHPNIARLIDGGLDEHGAPWLAMEYVEGESITAFARERGLDARAIVRLFVPVCACVQYAHENLIVHRDIKPSNILVTPDGAPKLLDFGIAKVLSDDADARLTVTGLLTPDYAAPEQWSGGAVSTATDVYSLGVVLYEVLCGRRPQSSARASENDVVAPSIAVRGSDRTRARVLAGDLDRIVMHALQADPSRRYRSVAALRDDLERWLTHRPISIAPPGFFYPMSRFVTRHRVGVAIVAVAIVALAASGAYAMRQAQRAERFAVRAEHANRFLSDLFASANPYDAQHTSKDARDLLRDAAQHIDTEFADAPDTQIQLRETIANVLFRIGDPGTARDLLQRNVDQLRRQYGSDAPQVGAQLQLLGLAAEASGELDAARADFAESWKILRNAGDAFRRQRISVMTGLAKMANRGGDRVEARRMHEAILAERRAFEGPDSADIAMDLMNLAADSLYDEKFPDAESLGTQAHAMLERVAGPRHPRSIYVDNVLGAAQLSIAGKVETGRRTLNDALDLARATLPANTESIGTLYGNLGRAESNLGDEEAAIAMRTQAREIFRTVKSSALNGNDLAIGIAQLQLHRAEALDTLRGVRDRMQVAHSDDAETMAWADAAYGAALAANGRIGEGETLARDARRRLPASSATRTKTAHVDCLLADILEAAGKTAEARSVREEALQIYRSAYGVGHPVEQLLAAQLARGDLN